MPYKKQTNKQQRRALILTTTATTTRQQPYLTGCVKTIEKQATKKKNIKFCKVVVGEKNNQYKLSMELIKGVGKQTNFDNRRDLLIQNIIHGIGNGHIYLVLFIYVVYTGAGIIAFCHHVHFQLCGNNTVAFAYHGAKGAVAAELGVGGDHEVAKVGAVVNVAGDGVDDINKAFHFANGVGNKDGLEIIAITEAVANAGAKGVYIFKHGAIFGAINIIGRNGFNKVAGEEAANSLAIFFAFRSNGEVG